jgi:hypothetical protein
MPGLVKGDLAVALAKDCIDKYTYRLYIFENSKILNMNAVFLTHDFIVILQGLTFLVWAKSIFMPQAKIAIDQIRQFDSLPPSHHNSKLPHKHPTNSTTMAPSMSLFSVNAILILNSDDGSRVFAKYYSAPHHASGPTHAQSRMPSLPSPPRLPIPNSFQILTNMDRYTNSTNPLPRRKIPKSIRKRPRREDSKTDCGYYSL